MEKENTVLTLTPKMLYEMACAKGAENAKIIFDYNCEDDFYCHTAPLTTKDIKISRKRVRFNIIQ